MSAWPSGLPSPEIKSYKNADKFNVIRTDMESGPPRQSRRSAHYMSSGSFTLTLTSAQMTIFRTVIVDSNSGADWITGVPLDTGGGNQPHRMRIIGVSHKLLKPQSELYSLTVKFETDEHET
jgi:hypothetical protein